MAIKILGDIVSVVSEHISNPSKSGYHIFVGLEHYDSGEPVITRHGSTEQLESSVKHFIEGDILVARRNVYLKRAGVVNFEGVTSGDSIVLRVKEEKYKDIIPFILNTDDFWDYAEQNSDGTMSKRLAPDVLLEYECNIPENHQSIADKLWAAYKLKVSYKQMITAIDEMVKSQFIEMFGDPMTNTKEWSEYGKINQYAQVILGTTPNSKEASYWDGDIKWITPAEMTDESYYIYDTERHITEDGVKSASLTLLPYRSVLFSTRAPIGKVGLAGAPMYCNQGFKNFICGEKLNPVYLYYSLIYKRDYLISLGTGTTFKELSKKTVEGLNIAVPPIHLQNQFESIYDQADKSKFTSLKSQFIEMFGTLDNPKGEIESLGSVCNIQRGGSPRPISEYITDQSDGLNWIKIGDTDDSMYITKTEEKIKPSGLRKTREVYAGDLLLSNSMSFGRPYILKIDGCIHDGWLVLHINDSKKLSPVYLCSYLSQQGTYAEMAKLAAGGVVQNLNSNIVKQLDVIVPDMKEQIKYIQILEQADKSKYIN